MKTAVITGTTSGIGEALARRFLADGFRVIGTSFSKPSPFSDVAFTDVSLDLSNPVSVVSCAKGIEKALGGGKIDILVNNAGVLLDDDDTTVVVEKLRKTLEVNVIGTIDLTERLIPLMASGGHIVNITSRAGSLEMAARGESHHPLHYPSYKISKAAANMYSMTLSLRLAPAITVSAAHPGWVKTAIGGEEADISPAEAAEGLFALAISRPPTGGFWFKGERLPW